MDGKIAILADGSRLAVNKWAGDSGGKRGGHSDVRTPVVLRAAEQPAYQRHELPAEVGLAQKSIGLIGHRLGK